MNILYFIQKLIAFSIQAVDGLRFWQSPEPLIIPGYTYIKTTRVNSKSPFFTATYKDVHKKLVHIKACNRHPMNLHYHNLQHEARMLSLLNKIKPYKTNGITVSAPKLLRTLYTPTHFCVVTLSASGNSLSQASPSALLTLHKYSTAYLHYAYSELWKKMSFIPYKGRRFYISTLPLITFLAFWSHPRERRLILRAAYELLVNAYIMFSQKNITLVHGDLHVENILVDSNQITVLDMGQLMRTFSEYEYVTTFSSIRNKELFNQTLLGRFTQVEDANSLRYRLLLIILCSLHNLTSGAPQKNNDWYLYLLRYGLTKLKKIPTQPMRIPNNKILQRIAL